MLEQRGSLPKMSMPAKRSAMRKIKEVLHLTYEAILSHEKTAAATGMSKGAVASVHST
jgi:hypothetical protein